MFEFRTSGRKSGSCLPPARTRVNVARARRIYFTRSKTFLATPLIASVESPLLRSSMEKDVPAAGGALRCAARAVATEDVNAQVRVAQTTSIPADGRILGAGPPRESIEC